MKKYIRPFLKYSFIILSLGFTLWFFSRVPSNNRVWQKDVAVLPYATQTDSIITMHNIRNFEYTTESQYTENYYDDVFDLDQLNGIDIITSYWMGPKVAHVFLSFSFNDENNTTKHLAISIETRKEVGEEYSTFKGSFRQYELFYVVADERDLIGVRTNIRENPKENVYMYKLKVSKEEAQSLFLTYVNQINKLKETPQFYNTLTTNCTTEIWMNSTKNSSTLPFNWKILVSGYVPEYLLENDRLQNPQNKTFEILQSDALINTLVNDTAIDDNYSTKIRAKY